MRKNKIAGVIFLLLGAVLLIAALMLVLYNMNEDRRAGEAAEKVMPEVEEIIAERIKERENRETAEDTAYPDGSEQDNTSETEKKGMTVEMIAGYGYIGILSIPSLELALPIMEECTEHNLSLTPCKDYGSLEIDNMVIAGHNYKQHFGDLPSVSIGDEVTFTDMDGVVHKYKVGKIETLKAAEVEAMNNSEWNLSLYTCDYTGSERITVRCARVNDSAGEQ